MAKTSIEVSGRLDELKALISTARAKKARCSSFLTGSHEDLSSISSEYADLISEIAGYPNGNSHKGREKEQLAEYINESDVLILEVESDLTALGVSF